MSTNDELVIPAKFRLKVSPELGGVGLLPLRVKAVVELGVTLKVSLPLPPLTVTLSIPVWVIVTAPDTEPSDRLNTCPELSPWSLIVKVLVRAWPLMVRGLAIPASVLLTLPTFMMLGLPAPVSITMGVPANVP